MHRSNLVTLCAWIHRRGPQSIHGKQLAIDAETARGANGPLSFWKQGADGTLYMVERESAPGVLERDQIVRGKALFQDGRYQMPWVRIDDHAMEHPKVAGLPDGAFRLWVAGLSYCQKYLTDGFISDVAQRGLRAFSPRRRTDIVTAGLWRDAEGGVLVHDYLDWNESRAHVLSSREQARERLRKHKEKRVSNAYGNAHPTVDYVGGLSQDSQTQKERGVGKTDAVQRLVDKHQELHQKFRGVGYLGNPQKDYQAACELVAMFPDAGFQDALLTYGLNDTDSWMEKGPRTITRIKSQASKYAEELKAKKLA